MEEFTELGIPSASVRGRATIMGDARPGSLGGELLRSTAMYKSFVLSLMFNQSRHIASQRDLGTRLAYTAALATQMTLMGAVAVQLKEIVKGNDPRPMDDQNFWGAALLQGGGIGIFGDFISSTTSRAGGGMAETAAGPVVGLMSDVGRAVNSNVARMAEGRDPLFGRDASNLARRYNPLASHWVVRTVLDRAVWDQLQDVLDPEARESWGLHERRTRERGTQSFWRRGQALPDRAPNLSNMMGANP